MNNCKPPSKMQVSNFSHNHSKQLEQHITTVLLLMTSDDSLAVLHEMSKSPSRTNRSSDFTAGQRVCSAPLCPTGDMHLLCAQHSASLSAYTISLPTTHPCLCFCPLLLLRVALEFAARHLVKPRACSEGECAQITLSIMRSCHLLVPQSMHLLPVLPQ